MLDIKFVFTNEVPYLIENLTPAVYIRIKKFVSKNNFNFTMSPSLEMKVSDGINIIDTRTFESLLKTNHKNPNIVEANLNYYLEKAGNLKIEIENQNPDRPFQIAMYYTLERRTK
jgi:hypothetical protein